MAKARITSPLSRRILGSQLMCQKVMHESPINKVVLKTMIKTIKVKIRGPILKALSLHKNTLKLTKTKT